MDALVKFAAYYTHLSYKRYQTDTELHCSFIGNVHTNVTIIGIMTGIMQLSVFASVFIFLNFSHQFYHVH